MLNTLRVSRLNRNSGMLIWLMDLRRLVVRACPWFILFSKFVKWSLEHQEWLMVPLKRKILNKIICFWRSEKINQRAFLSHDFQKHMGTDEAKQPRVKIPALRDVKEKTRVWGEGKVWETGKIRNKKWTMPMPEDQQSTLTYKGQNWNCLSIIIDAPFFVTFYPLHRPGERDFHRSPWPLTQCHSHSESKYFA